MVPMRNRSSKPSNSNGMRNRSSKLSNSNGMHNRSSKPSTSNGMRNRSANLELVLLMVCVIGHLNLVILIGQQMWNMRFE